MQICSAHGCELIAVTVSDGGKVTDCPKCMETARLMREGFEPCSGCGVLVAPEASGCNNCHPINLE